MLDVEESSYEQWEVKFLARVSPRKLKKTALGDGHVSLHNNEQVYSDMVQCLDARCLSHFMRDAADIVEEQDYGFIYFPVYSSEKEGDN